jgi:hypothetical protein
MTKAIHPQPEDTPDKDSRSDLKRQVEARDDAADAAQGGSGKSPLEPSGVEDGVSGTAGEVKNQDDMAQ